VLSWPASQVIATPALNAEADWRQLYSDGEWVEASSGDIIPGQNLATQVTFTEVPAGTEGDVQHLWLDGVLEEARSDDEDLGDEREEGAAED
jgi:hypothetical protein